MARGVSGVAAMHGAAWGAHRWSLTGSLITGRGDHAATLLSNGQVLVAGGFAGGEAPYASAELYVPRSHHWIATGSMHAARAGHTATLLHTGQVLVTGGWSGCLDPRQPCAELYDPRTGRWTATGRMHLRWIGGHTATLLASGKVLVVGGEGGHGHLTSADVYDPQTGRWTVTGSLHTARGGHTATLLPNGTVLVAGGSAPAQRIPSSELYGSSAEVYDPRTGRWTVTAPMHEGRDAHTATLLSNGQVLVAGGQGNVTAQTLSSAELYDPRTSRWMVTPPMHDARYEHTATLLRDGTVLVAGTCCASADHDSSVELYR
jgi:Galactose oxidase, central domain/Kelch motif